MKWEVGRVAFWKEVAFSKKIGRISIRWGPSSHFHLGDH